MPDSPPPDLTNEADSAFVWAAGLVVDTVTATEVAGHLEVGADHHTSWGIVHGGVYSAAIESAAGVGASASVSDRGQFAVGGLQRHEFPSTGDGWPADRYGFGGSAGDREKPWEG